MEMFTSSQTGSLVKFDAITCARLFTCQTAAFLFTIANLGGFVMCKTCLYRHLFYMKMFIPAIVMSIRPTNIDVVLYKQSHATETFSKIDWKDWEGIIFGHILLIIIIS